MYWSPNFLAVVIKSKKFHSKCHQNAGFSIWVFKNFPGVIPPDPYSVPLLGDLHWLRIPRHIQYKLDVLVFDSVHGSAPRYLQEVIRPVENIEPRRRLRSASSADLTVPATRRSTLGDRAFAVASRRAWNTLPDVIRRCLSPDNFKRSLKTHLYIQSYF